MTFSDFVSWLGSLTLSDVAAWLAALVSVSAAYLSWKSSRAGARSAADANAIAMTSVPLEFILDTVFYTPGEPPPGWGDPGTEMARCAGAELIVRGASIYLHSATIEDVFSRGWREPREGETQGEVDLKGLIELDRAPR